MINLVRCPILQAEKADRAFFDLGEAAVLLEKSGGDAVRSYAMAGRIYLSSSGWLLLSVPNSIVRGAFDAMHEPGVELPLKDGKLDAHVTLMSPDEIEQIGGADNISERGHTLHFNLGPLKSVEPGHDGLSRVWYLTVESPEIRALRVAYGLPAHRKGYDYHVTVAQRRVGSLQENDVSKAAGLRKGLDDNCPECGERYKSQCRCRMGDRECKNGHVWHRCAVHGTVMGSGHGSSINSFDDCSCKEEKAAARVAFEATPSATRLLEGLLCKEALPGPRVRPIVPMPRPIMPHPITPAIAAPHPAALMPHPVAPAALSHAAAPAVSGSGAGVASVLGVRRNVAVAHPIAPGEAMQASHVPTAQPYMPAAHPIDPIEIPTAPRYGGVATLATGPGPAFASYAEGPRPQAAGVAHDWRVSGGLPDLHGRSLDRATGYLEGRPRARGVSFAGTSREAPAIGISPNAGLTSAEQAQTLRHEMYHQLVNSHLRTLRNNGSASAADAGFAANAPWNVRWTAQAMNSPHSWIRGLGGVANEAGAQAVGARSPSQAMDVFTPNWARRYQSQNAQNGSPGFAQAWLRGTQALQAGRQLARPAAFGGAAALALGAGLTGRPESPASPGPPQQPAPAPVAPPVPQSHDAPEGPLTDDSGRGPPPAVDSPVAAPLALLPTSQPLVPDAAPSFPATSPGLRHPPQVPGMGAFGVAMPAMPSPPSSMPGMSSPSPRAPGMGAFGVAVPSFSNLQPRRLQGQPLVPEPAAPPPAPTRFGYKEGRLISHHDLLLKGLEASEKETDTSPTPDQARAGNYKKGRWKWNGLEIAIENPRGSVRKGVSKSGKPWETRMEASYGYIARIDGDSADRASDGDHVDVFVSADHDLNSGQVFIVNQVDPDSGKHDEVKVLLGHVDEDAAKKSYLAHYEKGWKGFGSIVQMNVGQFKDWLTSGDLHKPAEAPRQKTVAMDLDGTIAEYSGWKGEDHFGKLRDGAREGMEELKRRGHLLVIWTTRGATDKVEAYLKKNKVPFDHVNRHPDQPKGSSGKVIADCYPDDRGVDASRPWGEFLPDVIKKLDKEACHAVQVHCAGGMDVGQPSGDGSSMAGAHSQGQEAAPARKEAQEVRVGSAGEHSAGWGTGEVIVGTAVEKMAGFLKRAEDPPTASTPTHGLAYTAGEGAASVLANLAYLLAPTAIGAGVGAVRGVSRGNTGERTLRGALTGTGIALGARLGGGLGALGGGLIGAGGGAGLGWGVGRIAGGPGEAAAAGAGIGGLGGLGAGALAGGGAGAVGGGYLGYRGAQALMGPASYDKEKKKKPPVKKAADLFKSAFGGAGAGQLGFIDLGSGRDPGSSLSPVPQARGIGPFGGGSSIGMDFNRPSPAPAAAPAAAPSPAPAPAPAASAGASGGDVSAKLATLLKRADDEGDIVYGNTRMKGWQWRSLQQQQQDSTSNWMPRVFQSDATPLTELLASPGKQSLLTGLLGGAAGAGLGYAGSSAAGADQLVPTLAGGGAGALLGGLLGYSHRRNENDRVIDALRRSPPGATVHDYRALQHQDEKQAACLMLNRVLGRREPRTSTSPQAKAAALSDAEPPPDLSTPVFPRFTPGASPDVGLAAETGFADSFASPTMGDRLSGVAGPALLAALLASPAVVGLLHHSGRPDEKQRKRADVEGIRAMPSGVLDTIRSQFPRIRLPDTLVGGTVGGLGGLAVDLMRQPAKPEDKTTRRLKSVLTGAGAGALLTNVAGDRARRYITNTVVPGGYTSNQSGILPRSWEHFWNAAVLDRPQHPAPTSGSYSAPGWQARHELMRREFGVHSGRPETDVFARNTDGSYSLNPANASIDRYLPLLLGAGQGGSSELQTDPVQAVAQQNHRGGTAHLMGDVIGGQVVRMTPSRTPEGTSHLATVRDRWDYTLNPAERSFLQHALGRLVRGDLGWGGQSVGQNLRSIDYGMPGMTNQQAAGMLGARQLVDALADEHPWVHQHVQFDPQQTPQGTRYNLTPMTGDGIPYPGYQAPGRTLLR